MLKHIPEIDGLRALAVLLVLLFHLDYPWAQGGFVGVDVFFVISGFLISKIIVSDLDRGRFSFATFYERRVRRIAPALLSMLAACSLYLLVFPAGIAEATQRSLFAALLSASNFWFYSTTDYFNDHSTDPLLHTWSLSVEEQFYLALPLLLWLVARSPRATPALRLRIVIGLTLLSFVASAVLAAQHSLAAFYLPWLRAWELLAGTLLAIRPPQFASARAPAVLGLGGLAAILWSCVAYTPATAFPGVAALLPVLGSCAVLASTGAATPVNRLLATAPLGFIGKISYSLYLVHWPLIALVATLHGVTPKTRPVLALLSILLAWVSWRWIETPFRTPPAGSAAVPHRALRRLPLAMSGIAALVALASFAGQRLWQALPQAQQYASYLNAGDREFRRSPCWLRGDRLDLAGLETSGCLRPEAGQRNLLLIGDSHSAALATALQAQLPALHLLNASRANCLPYPPAAAPASTQTAAHPDPVCGELLGLIYGHWLDKAAVDTVVLSARWQAADREGLLRAVQRIRAAGKRVLVIGPSPEFSAMVPLLLAYSQISGFDFASRALRPEPLQLDLALAGLPELAGDYYSLSARLCEGLSCRLESDGVPTLSDRDHLTEAGARLALRELQL